MTSSLEDQFSTLLESAGIRFVQPDRMHRRMHGARLDFYLPDLDLYVELKHYNCERLDAQLRSVDGKHVLVLIGPDCVSVFKRLVGALK